MSWPWTGFLVLLARSCMAAGILDDTAIWSPDINEDHLSEKIFDRLLDSGSLEIDQYGSILVHDQQSVRSAIQQLTQTYVKCDRTAASDFESALSIIVGKTKGSASNRTKRLTLSDKDNLVYAFTVLSPYILGPTNFLTTQLIDGRRFSNGIGLSDFVEGIVNTVVRLIAITYIAPIRLVLSAVLSVIPVVASGIDMFNSITTATVQFVFQVIQFLGGSIFGSIPALFEFFGLVMRVSRNMATMTNNWATSIQNTAVMAVTGIFRGLFSSNNIIRKVISGKINLFLRIVKNLPNIVRSPLFSGNMDVLWGSRSLLRSGGEFLSWLLKLGRNEKLMATVGDNPLSLKETGTSQNNIGSSWGSLFSLGSPAVVGTAFLAFVKLPFILVYMTTVGDPNQARSDASNPIKTIFDFIDPYSSYRDILRAVKGTTDELYGLVQDTNDGVLSLTKSLLHKLGVSHTSPLSEYPNSLSGAINRLRDNLKSNWNQVMTDMIKTIDTWSSTQHSLGALGKDTSRVFASSTLIPWILLLTLSGSVVNATRDVLDSTYRPQHDFGVLLRAPRSLSSLQNLTLEGDILRNLVKKLNRTQLLLGNNTSWVTPGVDINRPLPIETNLARTLGRFVSAPNPKINQLLLNLMNAQSRDTSSPSGGNQEASVRVGRMSGMSISRQFQDLLAGRLNLIHFLDNLISRMKQLMRSLNPFSGLINETVEALKGDDNPLLGFMKAFPGFGLFEEFKSSNPGLTPISALGLGALLMFKIAFFAPLWIPMLLLRSLNEEQRFNPFKDLFPRLTLEDILHPGRRSRRSFFPFNLDLHDIFHEPPKPRNPIEQALEALNPINALIRGAERTHFGRIFSIIRRMEINPLERIGVAALISFSVLMGTFGATFGLMNLGRGNRQSSPFGKPFGASNQIDIADILNGNNLLGSRTAQPPSLIQNLPLLGLFLLKSVLLPFPISILGVIGFFSILLMGGKTNHNPNFDILKNISPSSRTNLMLTDLFSDLTRKLNKSDKPTTTRPPHHTEDTPDLQKVFAWLKTTPAPTGEASTSPGGTEDSSTFQFTDSSVNIQDFTVKNPFVSPKDNESASPL